MKIDMTAGQAQIALEILFNELWRLENQSPIMRNQMRADATRATVKTIAAKMLQDGFIDHEYYNIVCSL